MSVRQIYTSGEYLSKNPDWHLDAAPWKAQTILKLLDRNQLTPRSICDIGCGAGEILRILQQQLNADCRFSGYDISPQAVALAKPRENDHLHFFLATDKHIKAWQEQDAYYDLILLIDVVQHIEDSYGYLRDIKPRSAYKIVQLPLDIAVLSVLQNKILGYQRKNGHINFYTKDLALHFLQDCGYEVVDYFYAISKRDMSPWSRNPRKFLGKLKRFTQQALLRFPAHLCYLFHQDLAVRIFGGWRLIVLMR